MHLVSDSLNTESDSTPSCVQQSSSKLFYKPVQSFNSSIQTLEPVLRPLSFDDSIWQHEINLHFEVDDDLQVNQHSCRDGTPTACKSHSAFKKSDKWLLIVLISFAAIFSPLSSNIYFPALPTIASNLHISITLVTLSITSYLIAQGIAPSFWGPLSDSIGRRPIFLATFLVYMLANLGLGLSRNFPALMAFRALQATGSSATIALGSGVIGDVTIQSERGSLMGFFGGLRMFGQAFGPVLGGLLAEFLGFRSIFWFLLIAAGIVAALLFMFLPETHPDYVGQTNGFRKRVHQTGWSMLKSRKSSRHDNENSMSSNAKSPLSLRNVFSTKIFYSSFLILCEKDILLTLLFGAVIYTVWSMVTASTSTLFKEEYHLTNVEIGLIFIPNGVGCVLGSYTAGIIMDRTFKTAEKKHCLAIGLPHHQDGIELSQVQQQNFPLEKARMRSLWYIVPCFIGSVAGYGWTVESNIAIPLSLQFIIAFTATAVFSINSTLIIDLYPSKPASASAVSNLLRCLLGAIGVGIVEKLQASYKERSLFTALAVFTLASCSLAVTEWRYGHAWRMKRNIDIRAQGS